MAVKNDGGNKGIGPGLIQQIQGKAGEAGKKVSDAVGKPNLDAILASLPNVPALAKKTGLPGLPEKLATEYYGADADVGTEQARDASPLSFLISAKMQVPAVQRWMKQDPRVAKWLEQLGAQGQQLVDSFTGGSANPDKAQLAAATEALEILATQLQGGTRIGADKIADFFAARKGDIDLLAQNGFAVLKARKDTAEALATS